MLSTLPERSDSTPSSSTPSFLSDTELNAEELALRCNYSAYTLKRFARTGIISSKAARQDPERSNAWVFKPEITIAEIKSVYEHSHRFPSSVRKSPTKK